MSFKTVEQIQDEVEQPRVDPKEAFIDGILEELAKMLAWLREQNTTENLELEDDLAKEIEARKHLK
jgi:hypothetical protein